MNINMKKAKYDIVECPVCGYTYNRYEYDSYPQCAELDRDREDYIEEITNNENN